MPEPPPESPGGTLAGGTTTPSSGGGVFSGVVVVARAGGHRVRQRLGGAHDRARVVLGPQTGLQVLRQDLLQVAVGDLDVVALPVAVFAVAEGDDEQEIGRTQGAVLGRLGRERRGLRAVEGVR